MTTIGHNRTPHLRPSPTPSISPFLFINKIPIVFSEDWDTGIGGGLWSTGLAIAKYFERHADIVTTNLIGLGRVKCSGKNTDERELNSWTQKSDENCVKREGLMALELGSGNGFLSVCLLALNASFKMSHPGEPPLIEKLVVTDMVDHISLIEKTLHVNSHVWEEMYVRNLAESGSGDGENEEGAMNSYFGTLGNDDTPNASDCDCDRGNDDTTTCKKVTVIAAEHRWGEQEIESIREEESKTRRHNQQSNEIDANVAIHNQKYDFIIGSDVAYRDHLHAPLISSLLHFSHEHTVSLIGITMNDTKPKFFDSLLEAGFRYERLADHFMEREFRGKNFGIFAIQRCR
mmetsp:Transcript_23731/g.47308  ORF Transcript_23731/g.47308 Transcript_23731/m.47308 type:complete len:346 (-) Transcript_23731:131-1168(-)